MPKQLFVDFKAVKASVSIELVLKRYDLLDEFKRSGDTLILRLDDFALAVELPVEGSLSYEFLNVKKCLAAGFSRVAVVSLRPKLLERLAEAVVAALGAEAAAKVSHHTPDEFISEFQKLAQIAAAKPMAPPKPNTETIGNYEVESEFPTLTAEEQKQREEAAIRVIADVMRRGKKQ